VKAPLDVSPGESLPDKAGKIVLNKGRKMLSLDVVSKCDRPIQVNVFHFNNIVSSVINLVQHVFMKTVQLI